MSTRNWLRLLALALASAAAARAETPEEPYLTIPAGTTQTLSLQSDGSYSVRLGVKTRPDVELSQLGFPIFDVQYKGQRPSDLADRFEVKGTPATNSLGDAIEIIARPGSIEMPPGNYVLVANVTLTKDTSKSQPFTFTLTMPAPSVTVGETVRIERVGRWQWRGGPELARGTLHLREESGTSNVSPMNLAWALDYKAGVPAPKGRLTLQSQTRRLAAGTGESYVVDIDDGFSPGTYTGKITVRSLQLAEPKTVNFEVLSRRNPLWLILLAAMGVSLGYVVRVVLKEKQDAAEASLSASLAMQKLVVANQRIEEPDVRSKIAAVMESLNAIQQDGKAAAITAGAAAALTALETIESEFKKKRDALAPTITDINKFLAKRLELPRDIQSDVASITTQLESITAAFARNNVTQAEKQLKPFLRGSLLSCVIASLHWRSSFPDFLGMLARKPGPINSDAARKLIAAFEDAKNQAPKNIDPPETSIAEADTELSQAHSTYTGGKRFVIGFSGAYEEFIDEARQKLAGVIPGDSAEWEAVRKEAQSLRSILATALEGPLASAASSVSNQIDELSVVFGGLLGQIAPEAQRARVAELVRSGSWVDAVEAALIRPAPAAGRTESVGAAAKERLSMVAEANLAVAPESDTPAGGAEPFVLTGSESERRLLRRSARQFEFAQTFILGVVFVVGVYLLNAETWIGTYKDMLAIGALGFGLDLSAQGVLAVLRK